MGTDKVKRKKQIFCLAVLLLGSICVFSTACSSFDSVSSNNSSVGNMESEGESSADNMAPITDTGEIVFTEEMLDTAIVNAGNTYRLANVMRRAEEGDAITIAYIGGSITDGSSASPKESSCYAYLSQQWWEETFPEATFTYINAGIGATDSYLGVHRVDEDVIAYQPDLVIVEFSVNDYQNHNKETYESLLRKLLLCESEPAVISLILTVENGGNYGTEHAAVAFKLGVPILSYSALLSEGMVTWEQVGNADGVHPDNPGHAVISAILTGFYRQVYTDREQILASVAYEVPSGALTPNRYDNAEITYSDGAVNGEEVSMQIVSMEGFSPAVVESALTNRNGWISTEGGSFVFTVECRAVGILFLKTTDGLGGQYEVFVDGVSVSTINADFSGGWGNSLDYIECVKSSEAAMHTIEIHLQEGSTGTSLAICGICVAK